MKSLLCLVVYTAKCLLTHLKWPQLAAFLSRFTNENELYAYYPFDRIVYFQLER